MELMPVAGLVGDGFWPTVFGICVQHEVCCQTQFFEVFPLQPPFLKENPVEMLLEIFNGMRSVAFWDLLYMCRLCT